MSEMHLVEVPGTGLSIELPMRRIEVASAIGAEARSFEVPSPLPIQFREIVIPSSASAHWLHGSFGPRVDPDGFVFLGRAIVEVGNAVFGAEWRGAEFAVNMSLQSLPDRAPFDLQSKTVPPVDKFAAIDLLGKGDPPRKSGWDWIADAEWRKAQELREEALAYVNPARARLSAILEALELAFAKGRLVARLQPIEGGELETERPASEWQVPYATLFRRLVTCRMCAGKPFAPDGSSHWIFVSRAGLNKMLADQRKRDADETEAAKPKTSVVHLDAFTRRVHDAVRARPDGPSERDQLIKEGREIYRLPKDNAERAFKDAVDTAGVPHDWSRTGPKKKP